ncbi:MAG: glycosyltransferase family 2 protein [Candidatus Portnoybacteria bacterium]
MENNLTKTKGNSKVSVIILTWNGIQHISNCLESVQKSSYLNYEIIVVDNGSKDGTPEMISKKFPQVRLILNKKNLGFTGGNNQGVKQAKGDVFFLLNDDTKIHPDLISVLVQELESSSQIGIVGPKIYFMPASSADGSEPDKIWFAGGKIDWSKSDSYHLGKNLTDRDLSGDSKKEVDFITGCALMIKREVVDKVGLFDNKLFAFYEDADLCQKAKKAGYQVIYIPFGGVWHIKSATASRVFLDDLKSQMGRAGLMGRTMIVFKMIARYLFSATRQKGRHYRNRFIFFMRHAPFKHKITFLIRFIFIFTPQFLWSVVYQTLLSLIKIAYKFNKND